MENKVRLAVIGLGNFGRAHIRAINECEDAELVIGCDTDEERRRKTSEEYNVLCTADYDEILKRDDIDAVTLPIPDQIHRDYAVRALKAGKHVLCEKPMSLDTESCRDMIAASRESGKLLMVGQICRFTPSFIKAKELVDSGEIGELFYVESEYAHDYSNLDSTWRFDPASPRHPMIGGGCHAVDLLRWIAGNPTEVFAYSNHKILTDWPTDDCTIAVMQFPNKVIGKVFCSIGCKRKYTMRTVLYGSKGTIIVDNRSSEMTVFKSEVEGRDSLMGHDLQTLEIKIPTTIDNHNVLGEIREFCNAIKTKTKIKVDGVEGASTVAVCTAIAKSAEIHAPVTIEYDF